MADVVDREIRSRMMAGIRGKNTRPEMIVRKGLFTRGLRYRLHVRGLPGKPDLVFPKYHTLVFVHGCFWHGHECRLFKWPSTNVSFWKDKIGRNIERDEVCKNSLVNSGWRVAIVWECAIRDAVKNNNESILDYLKEWITGTPKNEKEKTCEIP